MTNDTQRLKTKSDQRTPPLPVPPFNQQQPSQPAASRRVWLFGGLRLLDDRGAFHLHGDKLQNLFTYLAMHAGLPIRRDLLIDRLWPEADWAQGRRRLANTLYRLRQRLGDGWLTYSAETIKLNVGADLWLDTKEAEKLYRLGTIRALQMAVELYAGELLPEVYGAWVLAPRQMFHEYHTHALRTLAEWAENTQQLDLAVHYFHQLTQVDALDEVGYRGLMRVYGLQRRYVAALQQFERVHAIFAEEFAAPPSEELIALAEILRAEQRASLNPSLSQPPFVGREVERQHLLTQLEQLLQGQGGLIFVEGEAGIGKTALLQEFAKSIAWRGIPLIQSIGEQKSSRMSSFSPLVSACHTYLTTPKVAPLLDQIRKRLPLHTQVLLTKLLPVLHPDGGVIAWTVEPNALSAALTDLLVILAEQGPHVLIFDDIEWAESGFWALLQAFVTRHELRSFLIILAFCSANVRTDERAWQALQLLDRTLFPLHLSLTGLGVADCRQLVQRLGGDLAPDLLAPLHRLTGGNPLFLQQALRYRKMTANSPQQLFATFIADLPAFARTALQVGAVFDAKFTGAQWRTLLGETVEEAAEPLVRMQLLEVTPQGYQITNELVRTTALALLPPDELRQWQQRVARLLHQEGAAPSILARYYEQAGLTTAAAHQHYLAGELARASYRFPWALEHYDQALALVAPLTDPEAAEQQQEWLALRLSRQAVLRGLGRYVDCEAEIATLLGAAELLQDEVTQLQALLARMELSLIVLNYPQAALTFGHGVQLAQKLRQKEAEVLMRLWWAALLALGEQQDVAALTNTIEDILCLVDELGNPELRVRGFTLAASSYLLAGQHLLAKEYSLSAYHLLQLQAHLLPCSDETLLVLVQTLWAGGDLATAWQFAQQLLQLPKVQADLYTLSNSYFCLVGIATHMGETEHALAFLGQWRSQLVEMPQHTLYDHLTLLLWLAEFMLWSIVGNVMAGQALWLQRPAAMEVAHDKCPILLRMAWRNMAQLCAIQERHHETIAICAKMLNACPDRAARAEFYLFWALAAARTGDEKSAKQQLTLAENDLFQLSGRYKLFALFMRALIYHTADDLTATYAELQRQAQQFPEPQRRQYFLQNIWLHREIAEAWQAQQRSMAVVVRLARLAVPLGKQLTTADLVEVAWTPDAGARDAEILQIQGKVALRRQRILRLFQEANRQGAAPTNKELAQALHVTVRTIDSDLVQLAVAGLLTNVARRPR